MILGILMLALCGCIKVKDELTINADGSGKIYLETQSKMPAEMIDGLTAQSRGGEGGGVIYPPTSEAEAKKFFPEKDFTVTVKEQKTGDGGTTTVIEAGFKDINALLASPYGHAHQLSLKIADGALVVRGISGLEATARMAEMKDDSSMGMGMGMMPGLTDLQKQTNDMRSEFRLTLPNAITSANGTQTGKTSAWIVERAKCKDAADFAQQLGMIAEVKCSADGLKMSPVTPIRLALSTFAGLSADVTEAGTSVDTNKIAAAAKFVPYGLSITRSLDLSGEGNTEESSAKLIGAVTIPRELAPKKWGQPELTEARDAKGNDLKPGDADEARNMIMRYSNMSREDSDDEESATNNLEKHPITLAFHSPDWKINEIARIKGSMRLQYFGGSQVIKLTNAIPAKWIMDVSKMMGGGGFDTTEKSLESAPLKALGLEMSVQTCIAQTGMTMLMLQVKGGEAALTDAQVFDADGKPWPTYLQFLNYGNADSGVCQVMVTGKPKAPLSLAFLASGSGTSVDVPILMEHIPLSK